jgi:hypothetical protein
MRISRRRFLRLAAGAAALPAASRVARAQAYPSRPVRIIVGYPAGAATDIVVPGVARLRGLRSGAAGRTRRWHLLKEPRSGRNKPCLRAATQIGHRGYIARGSSHFTLRASGAP